MMALTGVDPAVVPAKNPTPTEITDNYDPKTQPLLFAEMTKTWRKIPPPHSQLPKMANSLYQPIKNDMQGFDKHAYIVTVPNTKL